MAKAARLFPKLGNPPVFVYREEVLKPWKPEWDRDDPYENMPKPGHPMALMDLSTGRETEFYVWEYYRAPARLDWLDVSRRFLGAVAASGDYTPTEFRVLLWLFGKIGFGNAAMLNQGEVGNELRVTRSMVGKALAGLVDKGALVKVPVTGRSEYSKSSAYRLNANLGVAAGERLGRSDATRKAQDAQDEEAKAYQGTAA